MRVPGNTDISMDQGISMGPVRTSQVQESSLPLCRWPEFTLMLQMQSPGLLQIVLLLPPCCSRAQSQCLGMELDTRTWEHPPGNRGTRCSLWDGTHDALGLTHHHTLTETTNSFPPVPLEEAQERSQACTEPVLGAPGSPGRGTWIPPAPELKLLVVYGN